MEASAAQRRPWVLLGVILVSAVILFRMLLNFRHALPPATDGAYYPMQTWWLIEHGRLMYDDLPLMFWLNAGLALVIQTISGMPLDEAAMLASRLIDSVAQPLVAIFILMLGYVWSAGKREALLGCGAAAVLAVFSPPIMRMASDFQKNSLGLVWMVFALWAMHRALAKPRSVGRWLLLASVVFLCGLTHIGAFGVTCIMLMTAGVVFVLTHHKAGARVLLTRKGVAGLLIAAGWGAALLGVLWLFDPSRTVSLLTAPWRLMKVSQFRPSPAIVGVLVVYVLLGVYMRWMWRNRKIVARCDAAVVLGASAAIVVMVCPFFPQDYLGRFMLMTPVPVAVLLAFLIAHRAAAGQSSRPAKAVAIVVLLLAMISPFMTQGPTIGPDEAAEIKTFSDLIPDPFHTLVVAPHGVQYWAGLLLHTPVRMGELPEDAFTRYQRVLILEQTSSSHRLPPPQPRGNDNRRPGRDGPPEPPGLHKVILPAGAKLIHQTSHFKLYEIDGAGQGLESAR